MTKLDCVKCEDTFEKSGEPQLAKIQSHPDYALCQSCFDGETTFTCEMCGDGLAGQQVDYSNGYREWWCSSCCEDQSLTKDGDGWILNWTDPDFLLPDGETNV